MNPNIRLRAECALSLALLAAPPLLAALLAGRLGARALPLAAALLLLLLAALLLARRALHGAIAACPAEAHDPLRRLPHPAPLLVACHGTAAASAGLIDRLSPEERAALSARERLLATLPGDALAALHALLAAAHESLRDALARPLGRGLAAGLLRRLFDLAAPLLDLPFRRLHAARDAAADRAALAAGVDPAALHAAFDAHLFACVAHLGPPPRAFRDRLLAHASPFDASALRETAVSLEFRDLIRRDRIIPHLIRARGSGRQAVGRPFRKAHPADRALRLLTARGREHPAPAAQTHLDDLLLDRAHRALPPLSLLVAAFAVAVSGGDRFTAGIAALFLGLTLLFVHRERYAIGAPFLRMTVAELKADPAVGAFAGVPVVIEARRILVDPRDGEGGLALHDGDASLPLDATLFALPVPAEADGPFHAVGYFRRDDLPRLELLAAPGADALPFLFPPRAKRFAVALATVALGAALTLSAL